MNHTTQQSRFKILLEVLLVSIRLGLTSFGGINSTSWLLSRRVCSQKKMDG